MSGHALALDGGADVGGPWSADGEVTTIGDPPGVDAGDIADWTPLIDQGFASYTVWVDTDAVNVRTEASTEAEVRDRFFTGDALTVVGTEVNGYLPIDYFGVRGWVASVYVRGDGAPGPDRWIDVDRSSGMVTLYEGGQQVFVAWGSMGFDQTDDGFYATANGTFHVYAKNSALTWTDWGRVYIQNWVAFDPSRSNGFHSFSLDQNGNVLGWGENPTYGCVALAPGAAEVVYEFARLGTRVEVHW